MFKKLVWVPLAVSIVIAVFAIPFIFIKGALWVSANLLQPLIDFGWWVAGATVIVLPFALIRKFRLWIGAAILYSSFVYGLIAWLTGFVITYHNWGVFGVCIGLFFAGVGVIPLGLLSSALKGWDGFVPLLILVGLQFGSMILGFLLIEAGEPKDA